MAVVSLSVSAIRLTWPVIEYSKHDGKWGGPQCGLGYGGQLKSGKQLKFSAASSAEFVKVEFHDGPKILATAETVPWEADVLQLEPGLRALFAVGIDSRGERQASRPAFVIVEKASD